MPLNVSTTGLKIDGNTVLQIKTGNEGFGKVLVSDSDGQVDWTSLRGLVSTERYIGELYGGGIVVGLWNDGADKKVLIAYPNDVSTRDFQSDADNLVTNWTNNGGIVFADKTTSFSGATSIYDGKSNTKIAYDQIFPSIAAGGFYDSGGAVTFNASHQNFDGRGYNDWYLPSVNEMKTLFSNAHVIDRVLGDGNLKVGPRFTNTRYWTSTEFDNSKVWVLDTSMLVPVFTNAQKSSAARIRPVRLEGRSAGNGLTTYLDATDKLSYNDSTRGFRWSDLVNNGATSSYSFTPTRVFFSSFTPGLTYSPLLGGYMVFNGNAYVPFSSPIGSATTITVEMWANLKPDQNNKYLFGFGSYTVAMNSGAFGFSTFNGDILGLGSTQVTELGLTSSWKHYVFEMNSNVSYSNNKIWINNSQVPVSQVLGTENVSNRTFGSGNGRIGGNSQLTSEPGGTGFPTCGVFDCSVFKVYKRSITAEERAAGYNRYKRKYEIDIPTTHSIDVGPGPGTFSVQQNLKLNLTGKKNMKVLKSTIHGTASWVEKNYLFYRPDNERFVGDIYGGGIIVSSWRYPANVFNYLIMSPTDISASTVWSNVNNATIFFGNASLSPFSDFNGATNSLLIRSQSGHSSSAAQLCANYTSNGWGGWYLPSVHEMTTAFANLASFGYSNGAGNFAGRYWTSTEYDATRAFVFDAGGTQSGFQFTATKSSFYRVRAFRQVRILANYKVWNQNVPEDEPTGDWYIEPYDERNWDQYPGVRRANLIFDFDPTNDDYYSGRRYGLVGPAYDKGPNLLLGTVRPNVTWDSTEVALNFNGTYSSPTTFTQTDYLSFNSSVDAWSQATLEAWIKPDAALDPLGPTMGIVCTQGFESVVGAAFMGHHLAITPNDGTNTYKIIIESGNGLYTAPGTGRNSSDRVTYTTTGRPLKRGAWHHVVAMMNGLSLVGIYVNGVSYPAVGSGTGNGNSSSASARVMIGCSWGGFKRVFKGLIGPVRVYNRNLSVKDVKNNFERDRFRYDV